MAAALARFRSIEPNETGIQIVLHVMFTGADTGTIAVDTDIVVPITGAEQPAALRSLMSQAIAAWPAANGNSWTVPTSNMILPTFQKG